MHVNAPSAKHSIHRACGERSHDTIYRTDCYHLRKGFLECTNNATSHSGASSGAFEVEQLSEEKESARHFRRSGEHNKHSTLSVIDMCPPMREMHAGALARQLAASTCPRKIAQLHQNKVAKWSVTSKVTGAFWFLAVGLFWEQGTVKSRSSETRELGLEVSSTRE